MGTPGKEGCSWAGVLQSPQTAWPGQLSGTVWLQLRLHRASTVSAVWGLRAGPWAQPGREWEAGPAHGLLPGVLGPHAVPPLEQAAPPWTASTVEGKHTTRSHLQAGIAPRGR